MNDTPTQSGMTDEDIVAALAETMLEARVGYYTTTAEILLPTVRRIAKQWAAAELLAAAELTDTWSRLSPPGDRADVYAHVHDSLRARVAALTATPNHGRNAT